MPLYEITTAGEEAKRLVDATSSSQAIRHCAKGRYTARTIQKPTDVAALMSAGVAVEKAAEDAE